MKSRYKITAICIAGLFMASLAYALTAGEIQEAYYKSYNYEKLQDYENAISALTKVINEYPQGYTIQIRLGWLYYLKGNFANAIYHYQQAIKINPSALDAKLGYTYPLLAQNKYEDVESLLYAILSLDHYNYYANLKLAYVLRMQKKYDLAQKIVSDMMTLYPIDVALLTELALIMDAKNEKQTSLSLFWDITILDPENPTANMYLQKKDTLKAKE